jgi:hypothetical protein
MGVFGFEINEQYGRPIFTKSAGFVIERLENFVVVITDSLGTPVEGATVKINYGGRSDTYTTDQFGGVATYIDIAFNEIKVLGWKDCVLTEEKIFSHNGKGFYKSVTLQLLQLPCLYPSFINGNNFIRWQISNNLALPLTEPPVICADCDGDIEVDDNELPNAYEISDVDPYQPVLLQGEQFGFYINKSDGFQYADFNNLRIAFLDVNERWKTAVEDISALKKHHYSGSAPYRMYASFEVPEVKPSVYRIAIYNKDTKIILLVSNEIKIHQNTKDTVLLKYRHNRNDAYFDFAGIEQDFYCQIRLDISKIKPVRNLDMQTYDSVTSGKRRIVRAKRQRIVELETDYFDEKAHDAFDVMQSWKEIYMNGKRYVLNEAYQEDKRKDYGKSRGKVQFIDQKFSTLNK